jgi:hypothetical protein
VFSKTYHARARRGGLIFAGAVLEEMVERAADRHRFYRPGLQPNPGAKAKSSLQLELFAQEPPARDAEPPLFDLLPEAYTSEGL